MTKAHSSHKRAGHRGRWAITEQGLVDLLEAQAAPAPGGQYAVKVHPGKDGWTCIGGISDTHLGSKHERLDVLNALYDLYEEAGVTQVFHGGNWIEGEARFNRYDINVYGMDAQVDYFIDHYPQRSGLTTYYVAGDDHEGWYQQRELVNIGERLEERAQARGRQDLVYLGYVEADVQLVGPGGVSTPMRVMHAGGGSSYAISYAPQKIIESLQGGEKPSILFIGHYHKAVYLFIRNIHTVSLGTGQDQSMFMRKHKIEAHVGGWIIRFKQDPIDGHITRFAGEFIPFYDRGYYEKRYELLSSRRVKKGR